MPQIPYVPFYSPSQHETPGSRADHELMAAELSVEVRDVRLDRALEAMIDILVDPEHVLFYVGQFIERHPNYDNPILDAKAARLRELVS